MNKPSDIATRRALARANGDPEYLQRREELIEAAARVFRRKGFTTSKLLDIAEEMGIDRASLYYYTSGKEELFEDVVAEAVRENVLAVEALRTEDRPADRKLATFVERLMESYERHYPYLYVYVQENMAHMSDDSEWNREMASLGRRFDDAVRGIIQQGLDEGVFVSGADARVLANGIIGMCNWSYRWFHPKKGVDAKAIGYEFSAMILNGLRAPSNR